MKTTIILIAAGLSIAACNPKAMGTGALSGAQGYQPPRPDYSDRMSDWGDNSQTCYRTGTMVRCF